MYKMSWGINARLDITPNAITICNYEKKKFLEIAPTFSTQNSYSSACKQSIKDFFNLLTLLLEKARKNQRLISEISSAI